MIKLAIQGLKIDRLIARGGMAEVYLAEQISLGRKVAIKVLDSQSKDPEFVERFLHEAKLVAALHHNNIITIYDFGKLDGNRLFLSMEYLPGGDMETRLKRGITEKETIHILKELGRGLNFIHQKQIIHRDIKPANILFRQDGSLVLTDFGIAKEKEAQDVGVTQAGMIIGSPAYSSPEQAQGKALDNRSDIYSVGVMLFEMLAGTNPFRADTNINTAIKHIQMPIPVLPAKFARYQPMIEKMLAKNPQDRFASMLDVLNLLDNLTNSSKEKTAISTSGNRVAYHDLVTRCAEDSKAFTASMLQNFYEAINKKLDGLHETSRSNEQQWRLLEVSRNLRKKRDDLNRDFQNHLADAFKDFEQGEYKSDQSFEAEKTKPEKLSLLAYEDLERNIAAATLIKNIENKYSEELALLHERLCQMIEKNLPLEACPIGPYQLAHHFKQTVQTLNLDKQITTLFFKTLERVLLTQSGEFYKQLNKQLSDAGVLPKLDFAEVQKRRHASNAANSTGKSFSESGLNNFLDEQINQIDQEPFSPTPSQNWNNSPAVQQAPITPNADLPSGVYQQQLFGAIRQMQQASMMAPMQGTHPHHIVNPVTGNHVAINQGEWIPAGGSLPSAQVAQGPVYSREDIVTALSGLQDSTVQGLAVQIGNASVTANVTAKFQELRPGHLEPCPVQSLDHVIEAIAQVSPDEGEPKQLNQDDSGAIDLVAMIFEYLLKDEHLPDSVKVLLGYLQVPYIKVALLDPDVFARIDHPARVLLNRLSEAGALWLNKEGYGQFRVFDEIKRVVNRVLNEFADNTDLFDELLREFSGYVDTVNRRIDQLEKMTTQRAEAEHYLQKVQAHVHKRIKSRVTEEHIPASLVAFLLYPWFDYLTSLMLRHGEKSEQWQQGLQVIDNLLWSIKPKSSQHEVTRLNNLRDMLSKQIQKGFDTIGYNQGKADDIMKKIAELQEAAINDNQPVKISEADRTEITRMVKEVTVREKIVQAPDKEEMTADEQDLVNKLRLIEFGTWFEFKDQEKADTQKLKVAWFNGETLSYLMVNSAGKQVSVMTALEIARRMIAKTARIIAGSAKPFFERALEAIYKKMSEAMASANLVSGHAVALTA